MAWRTLRCARDCRRLVAQSADAAHTALHAGDDCVLRPAGESGAGARARPRPRPPSPRAQNIQKASRSSARARLSGRVERRPRRWSTAQRVCVSWHGRRGAGDTRHGGAALLRSVPRRLNKQRRHNVTPTRFVLFHAVIVDSQAIARGARVLPTHGTSPTVRIGESVRNNTNAAGLFIVVICPRPPRASARGRPRARCAGRRAAPAPRPRGRCAAPCHSRGSCGTPAHSQSRAPGPDRVPATPRPRLSARACLPARPWRCNGTTGLALVHDFGQTIPPPGSVWGASFHEMLNSEVVEISPDAPVISGPTSKCPGFPHARGGVCMS